MSDRKLLPGKFVWFELVTNEAKKAQDFYGEVFGWKTVPFPMGEFTYEMIYVGDTMIGGYAPPTSDHRRSHWISCVSVEDVDVAAKAVTENGGKVIEPPFDIPNIGRRARIADPEGAELYLFKSATGDPPDGPVPVGGWVWNELHTTDTAAALAFYEKVIGFSHTSMDMGPAGTYHIVSKGSEAGRGGVTSHLPPGASPHWLPYVCVDDPDATIARAQKLGAKIPMTAEDIPDVGRLAVLEDPTGAVIAILKPRPRAKI